MLSDTFSDVHWTVFWKPSQPRHLHSMKLCTLCLVAKHTCLNLKCSLSFSGLLCLYKEQKAVLHLGEDNKQDFPSKNRTRSYLVPRPPFRTKLWPGFHSADFTEAVAGDRTESTAGIYENTQHR